MHPHAWTELQQLDFAFPGLGADRLEGVLAARFGTGAIDHLAINRVENRQNGTAATFHTARIKTDEFRLGALNRTAEATSAVSTLPPRRFLV
jgi:hypothetical protein